MAKKATPPMHPRSMEEKTYRQYKKRVMYRQAYGDTNYPYGQSRPHRNVVKQEFNEAERELYKDLPTKVSMPDMKMRERAPTVKERINTFLFGGSDRKPREAKAAEGVPYKEAIKTARRSTNVQDRRKDPKPSTGRQNVDVVVRKSKIFKPKAK